jgi:integrase
LYRYGPTGTVYLCHKQNGKNVWKNLQTNDRKRAMAISSLIEYAGSQNGHTEITAWVGSGPPAAGSLGPQFVLPESTAPALALPVPGPVAAEAPVPVTPAVERRSGTTLNSLVAKFRAASGHLAPATREKFECHFKVAGRYLNFDREVASIKLAEMRELKSKLSEGRKPSSVNDIIFKALAALFQLAVDDELLERSPLEKLKRAKKGEPDRQQPTWDQANGIAANVAAKTAESGLIVKLMLNFGVGQAEIKFLRGEHIDLANGVVHFRRKKTGKHFDVPIFPHATGLVEALKAHGRLDVGKPVVAWRNPRKALAAACERLDLPLYEPRALRRCFIVHALELGIDPRLVARWQGHKDAGLVFKVYGTHIDAQHEKRQAQKMGNSAESPGVIPAAESNKGGDGTSP